MANANPIADMTPAQIAKTQDAEAKCLALATAIEGAIVGMESLLAVEVMGAAIAAVLHDRDPGASVRARRATGEKLRESVHSGLMGLYTQEKLASGAVMAVPESATRQ